MKKIILFLLIGIVSINIQAQKKISTNLVGGYKIVTIKNIIKNLKTYSVPVKSQFEKEDNYTLKVTPRLPVILTN